MPIISNNTMCGFKAEHCTAIALVTRSNPVFFFRLHYNRFVRKRNCEDDFFTLHKFEESLVLTFSVLGRDEWKLLAERLGLSQIEIDFLDKKFKNPCDVVLGLVGNHRYLSVGEIYDTLVKCELPAIADIM